MENRFLEKLASKAVEKLMANELSPGSIDKLKGAGILKNNRRLALGLNRGSRNIAEKAGYSMNVGDGRMLTAIRGAHTLSNIHDGGRTGTIVVPKRHISMLHDAIRRRVEAVHAREIHKNAIKNIGELKGIRQFYSTDAGAAVIPHSLATIGSRNTEVSRMHDKDIINHFKEVLGKTRK